MGNFIGLAFSTLKKAGINTKNMSIEEVIDKYNELCSTNQKGNKSLTSNTKSGSIRLPINEYNEVGHILMNKYAHKFVGITVINSANTMYVVKNVHYGEFEPVDKMDIEEFRDLIDLMEEDDDWR